MLNYQVPASRSAIVDTTTGYVNRDWYLFFTALSAAVNPVYAFFSSASSQTAAVINTAYAIVAGNSAIAQGVSVSDSKFTVTSKGAYNIQASLNASASGAGNLSLWLRVNGIDVSDSGTRTYVPVGNTTVTKNFVAQLEAGNYFELMWSVDTTNIQLLAVGATLPVPAIPSVSLTVTGAVTP
jgi:hypothetical protein